VPPGHYRGGVELVGERLALRPVSEPDLDFYSELRNNPVVLALPGREPRPRAEIAGQIRWWMNAWLEHGFGTWTVFDRETDERLGRVELAPIGEGWEGVSAETVEIGYIVHPAHWNQGVATEAALLAVADCFERVELSRLVALTTSDNKASLRTVEKLRMRHCGETRHNGWEARYEVFELSRLG
jgi:RimJ/RimL family protein N-acetyltransferase